MILRVFALWLLLCGVALAQVPMTGAGKGAPGGGGGAIAYDNFSSGGLSQFSGLSTASWTHAGGASITGVACLIMNDDNLATISGVTYGGAAMTKSTTYAGVTFPNATSSVQLWTKASPATGSQTVQVTASTTGAGFGAVCHSVTGGNTGTVLTSVGPTPQFNTNSAASINVTSVSGDIVVDVIATANNTAPSSAGGGQTILFNNTALTNGPNLAASASWKAAAGASTTMSWTISAPFNFMLAGWSFKQ